MSATTTQPLTLEEFLKLPETKPASEYINGEIIPKPLPELQLALTVNQVFGWLKMGG